jgi:ElaB/YqjD/DUF883 family membrane-anchored ribosome-binding protein
MNSETELALAREKLVADFKAIVADAEELLQVTAGQAGEKAGAVRDRIQQRLRLARAEFDAIEALALRRARHAASATDGYVHTHPWTAAGIAAGVGMLIGMLISRR